MQQEFEIVVADTVVEVDAMIGRQRSATLEAVDAQRQQTLRVISADLERVSNNAVDRAYSKVWLVLAVVWVGFAALLVLARVLFGSAAGRSPRS